jgi:hypothetical protein
MAEEGTLGQARASLERTDGGEEPSKEELQRRMEEAREHITQTVTEIKETVTNQYYSMKETVSEALDWRHHFRRNPIAFSVGALSVGFLVGYGLTGSFRGRGEDYPSSEDYPSHDETDVYARTGAKPLKYEDEGADAERHSAFHGHSFAAQAITDSPRASADSGRDSSYKAEEAAADYLPSRGASYSYSAPAEEREEAEKPGLFERFKGTPAYDRLQNEVASLGDRFIEELSTTAQTVVLPALFNKLKELFGVDLSGKQGRSSQQPDSQAAAAGAQGEAGGARAAGASASSTSASLASASRGSSGSSYATSENRGYGAQSDASGADAGGEGSPVLDLDR